jgi:hypothetical protein
MHEIIAKIAIVPKATYSYIGQASNIDLKGVASTIYYKVTNSRVIYSKVGNYRLER